METLSFGNSRVLAKRLLFGGGGLFLYSILRWYLTGGVGAVSGPLSLAALVLGLKQLQGGPRLVLDSTGVRYGGWGPATFAWSEFKEFRVWPVSSRQAVEVIPTDVPSFRRRLPWFPRSMGILGKVTAQPAFGISAAEVGMTPVDLQRLLQDLLERRRGEAG